MTVIATYQGGEFDFAGLLTAIADVDRLTGQSARAIGVGARAAYKAQVPSRRVARGVSTRQSTRGVRRTIRTGIVERPLGEPVHGRDIGTQALGWMLDRGTAGGGVGRITRRSRGANGRPLPFMHWGYPVQSVRGQRPQNWLQPARQAADAATDLVVAQLSSEIHYLLGRA